MSHQQEQFDTKNKDIESLDKIEDLLEKAELEIQRALTMVELGIDSDEAFKGVVEQAEEISELASSVSDEGIRFVVNHKVIEFTTDFLRAVETFKTSQERGTL